MLEYFFCDLLAVWCNNFFTKKNDICSLVRTVRLMYDPTKESLMLAVSSIIILGLGNGIFSTPDVFGGQIMYKKRKQEKTRKNIIFPKVPGQNPK